MKNDFITENGNRVIVENGEPQIIFNEQAQTTGYIDLDDAKRLIIESVRKIYEMNGDL